MNENFISLLKENNYESIREFINSQGKKAKPTSPIFYYDDLTEDQKKLVTSPIFKL